MKKLKFILLSAGILLLSAFAMVNESNESKHDHAIKAQSYYRASCTRNWTRKYYFERGNRADQQRARRAADAAARAHENSTGHNSGYLGPY